MLMLLTPHASEYASMGGWYVTVRMEIDCGLCENHIGKYTLYVQPWRS